MILLRLVKMVRSQLAIKIDLTDFGRKEESFNKLELTAVEEIRQKNRFCSVIS